MKERNYQLDLIKISAIIGVVFLHLSDGYLNRADYFFSRGLVWYVILLLRVLASAGVPLFMLTSGYLTIGKNYSPAKLIKRVLLRLLLPFIFLWIIASWTNGLVSCHLHNSALSLPLLSLSTLWWRFFIASGSLHFFAALIGLNLLLPLWGLLFTKKQAQHQYSLAKYIIVLFLLMSMSAILNFIFNPLVNEAVLNEWRWILWVGYFLLGYLIRLIPKYQNTNWGKYLFFTGLTMSTLVDFFTKKTAFSHVGAIQGAASYSLNYHLPWIVMMSVGAFIWILGCQAKIFTNLAMQKWLSFFASLTLGIYIFHEVIFIHLDVFYDFGLNNLSFWHTPALALFGLTMVVLFLSTMATILFSLFPALRLLVGKDKNTPN